jgi:AraC family transcriptional regulator of adaptative response / DNA-3-methyladenine glycosylase II
MRCGDPDILLETDLGVRRGYERLDGAADLRDRAEAWRPWRSYAVQHLWGLA